jgi:hypothetical protein
VHPTGRALVRPVLIEKYRAKIRWLTPRIKYARIPGNGACFPKYRAKIPLRARRGQAREMRKIPGFSVVKKVSRQNSARYRAKIRLR